VAKFDSAFDNNANKARTLSRFNFSPSIVKPFEFLLATQKVHIIIHSHPTGFLKKVLEQFV